MQRPRGSRSYLHANDESVSICANGALVDGFVGHGWRRENAWKLKLGGKEWRKRFWYEGWDDHSMG